MLHGAVLAIQADRQYRYDEESVVGPPTHRNIFAAHFPDVAPRVEAWNDALYSHDEPKSRLGARMVHEAQKRNMLRPPYMRDNVLALLREAADQYVQGAPQTHIDWTVVRDVLGENVKANGERVAVLASDESPEPVIQALSDLVAEIGRWDEIAAVNDAERVYVMSSDKQPLLADLRKLEKVERFFEAEGCEICRRNRGDPGSTTFSVRVR